MRIPRHFDNETPEINLIPMIDVLLVIIIFLAVSTSFSVERQVEVNLAQAQTELEIPTTFELTITADGQYAVQDKLLPQNDLETLMQTLSRLPNVDAETVLIIRADASTAHQNVVQAMQAARQAGIGRVSFAARNAP